MVNGSSDILVSQVRTPTILVLSRVSVTIDGVSIQHWNAIANHHTLQITIAHAKPSQSAFTSRFPVTDLNTGDSTSVLTSLLPGECPTTALLFRLTNFQAGGHLTPTSKFSLHRLTDNGLT
jgi:hypothetical protein